MGGGYQPDPIGNRRPVGQRSDNEVLARVQDVSSKVEDVIETYTQVSLQFYSIWLEADIKPIRPYIPAMARFLIVVTFIEGKLAGAICSA
jgi:hypothetical protein